MLFKLLIGEPEDHHCGKLRLHMQRSGHSAPRFCESKWALLRSYIYFHTPGPDIWSPIRLDEHAPLISRRCLSSQRMWSCWRFRASTEMQAGLQMHQANNKEILQGALFS